MAEKKLFLVTHKPKARLSHVLRTVISVVESTSAAGAIREANIKSDHDYCAPAAQVLQKGVQYYV